MKLVLSAVFCLVMLSACGAKKTCTVSAREVRATTVSCTDYTGAGYLAGTLASDACSGMSGTMGTTACPSGSVGSCKLLSGQSLETVVYYYTGAGTASALEAACGLASGTWTAG